MQLNNSANHLFSCNFTTERCLWKLATLEKRKLHPGIFERIASGPALQHRAASTQSVERLCCDLAVASALLFVGEFRPLCVIQALRIKLYVLSYSARSITTGILESQGHNPARACTLTQDKQNCIATVSKASLRTDRYSNLLNRRSLGFM